MVPAEAQFTYLFLAPGLKQDDLSTSILFILVIEVLIGAFKKYGVGYRFKYPFNKYIIVELKYITKPILYYQKHEAYKYLGNQESLAGYTSIQRNHRY